MRLGTFTLRTRYVAALAVLLLVAAAGLTYSLWWAWARQSFPAQSRQTPPVAGHPASHDHGHEHAEEDSIELSEQGLKNIGYRPLRVALGPFERTVTLPAMVVERPGQSQTEIPAPLSGIVTKIQVIQGAAIEPGSPMFEVRLTHEELVSAQREFLRTAESLDVVNREIERLKSVTQGVVAGNRILEQEYERQKLQASLKAERQGLLLHGLQDDQVDQILATRNLLQSLTVRAPEHDEAEEACRDDHLFHIQTLSVKVGEQVDTGQVLCVLADHCELYIEGRAFEDDALPLRQVLREGWNVSARLLSGGQEGGRLDGLQLLYLADHIDTQSRALRIYLRLPNEVALDQTTPQGRRFLDWRYKPGQRMELDVPVERWENRIVLPVDAVIDEGAEAFVFRQDGDHFDRVPVHVEYRDQAYAVIARQGALRPGDVVAARGAYQMHLALKNDAGGGTDPHAGHGH